MVNVPRVIERYIESFNTARGIGPDGEAAGATEEANSITKYDTVDDIPNELEGKGVLVYTEEKGFVES